jgi:hypothetical protein
MLNLLLGEHISPDVAVGLRRRNPALLIRSIVEWEQGSFFGQEDSACLQEAFVQGLTLVTYDRRTIPPLLKTWAEEAQSHVGVIFLDDKTNSPCRHRRAGQISQRDSESNAHMGMDR